MGFENSLSYNCNFTVIFKLFQNKVFSKCFSSQCYLILNMVLKSRTLMEDSWLGYDDLRYWLHITWEYSNMYDFCMYIIGWVRERKGRKNLMWSSKLNVKWYHILYKNYWLY